MESEPGANEYHQRILHAVQRTVIDQMMQQAVMEGNAPDVRAILADRLETMAQGLEAKDDTSPHERLAVADIRRWQSRIDNTDFGPSIQLPAGDPIGGSSEAETHDTKDLKMMPRRLARRGASLIYKESGQRWAIRAHTPCPCRSKEVT